MSALALLAWSKLGVRHECPLAGVAKVGVAKVGAVKVGVV